MIFQGKQNKYFSLLILYKTFDNKHYPGFCLHSVICNFSIYKARELNAALLQVRKLEKPFGSATPERTVNKNCLKGFKNWFSLFWRPADAA